MSRIADIPPFMIELLERLRRAGLSIGPGELLSLREALAAGFGWTARGALLELCQSLWAKSRLEREVVARAFEEVVSLERWGGAGAVSEGHDRPRGGSDGSRAGGGASPGGPRLDLRASSVLPPMPAGPVDLPSRPFMLTPRFPLSHREVVQEWRRLRVPGREGPKIELDLEATVARRCRTGVPAAAVFRSRRKNHARLLILVDRRGSMAPFHPFVDLVWRAMLEAGRIEQCRCYFFHNVPAEGRHDALLEALCGRGDTSLEPVLERIRPLEEGVLFSEPGLVGGRPLRTVLDLEARGAPVVVVSDAGAARRRFSLRRLLDTVAFLKALEARGTPLVWLNPLPESWWIDSTAAQIARHVPMFSLDRQGMRRAVDRLRAGAPRRGRAP